MAKIAAAVVVQAHVRAPERGGRRSGAYDEDAVTMAARAGVTENIGGPGAAAFAGMVRKWDSTS